MKNNKVINAEELFQDSTRKASRLVEKPDQIERLLKRLESKLRSVPKLGGTLASIPKMGMLLNSWIKGAYREIPIGSIAAVVGAVAYFIAPVDAIPDWIPVVGLLDDAGVVGVALHLIGTDLEEYMRWRNVKGFDKEAAECVV